ncbi:hypothetical protein GCM10011491_26100 [Brucella endophytica]|uniref:SH3b domain-containing protein n=1 Tax=Brucella endophytica TaxID=1963359 RepID=A0A916WGW7_9HYPH|nr:SH3 domain-containing protein [Brucella endophytica]GGA96532.1 hypothetical protein GCM10011491_26100 [Brucella endophytica]
MRSLLRTAALAVGIFATTAAQAATALVTTDLNVRTGPSSGYPALGALPNGAVVNVAGCTAGYGWCQVNYGGLSGWASSRYLAMREGSSTYSGNDFGSTAAAIGIPLIAGAVIGAAIADRDHDRWERRHWRDRDRWERRHWRDRDRWDRPRWHSRDRREWRDRRDWRDGRRWERRGDWRGRMGDGPHGR